MGPAQPPSDEWQLNDVQAPSHNWDFPEPWASVLVLSWTDAVCYREEDGRELSSPSSISGERKAASQHMSEKLSHLEMDMAGQATGPTSQGQKRSFQDSKSEVSRDISHPCSVKHVGSGSFPWLSTFHLMYLITSFHWIISFALTSCLLQIPCDNIRATQDNHSILRSSWSQDVQNPFCQARAVTENWGLRKPYSANHMENLKGPNVKQTCCEVKQKCSHESSYHGAKNISRWQQLGLIITQPTVRPGAETLTSVI